MSIIESDESSSMAGDSTRHPRAFGAAVLTADFRTQPEDFVVEELPSFTPTGEGEHLLLTIEKRGLNTVFVAKAIERVGDHAKNLAEQIIYIVKGTDVRHNPVGMVESLVR